MKKISLKNLNLKEVEQLSREQLKNVLGGFTGGSDEGTDSGTESGRACDPADCKGSCTVSDGRQGSCVAGQVECRCALIDV